MTVDPDDLYRLIDAFEASGWDAIHLRGEDFEIRLATRAAEHASTPLSAETPAVGAGDSPDGAPEAVTVAPAAPQ